MPQRGEARLLRHLLHLASLLMERRHPNPHRPCQSPPHKTVPTRTCDDTRAHDEYSEWQSNTTHCEVDAASSICMWD